MVFIFIGLGSNYVRTLPDGNLFSYKLCSIITSLFAIICAIVAICSFSSGCFNKFQKVLENDDGSLEYFYLSADFTWSLGASFILMIVVILLKFVDLVGNFLIPVSASGAERHGVSDFSGKYQNHAMIFKVETVEEPVATEMVTFDVIEERNQV
jgi:hypothetical protein